MLNENLLRGFTPIHEDRFDEQSSLAFVDQQERGRYQQQQHQQLLQRSDTEFDSNTPQVSDAYSVLCALYFAHHSLGSTLHWL